LFSNLNFAAVSTGVDEIRRKGARRRRDRRLKTARTKIYYEVKDMPASRNPADPPSLRNYANFYSSLN